MSTSERQVQQDGGSFPIFLRSDHILSYEVGGNYFPGKPIYYKMIFICESRDVISSGSGVCKEWMSRRLRLACDKVLPFTPATFQPLHITTVSSSQPVSADTASF